MNIQNLLDSIKNRNLSHSNYILCGEEEFFIDKIEASFLNHTIPQEEKVFNQKVLYGKETNVLSLITTLKSFPMIGSHQLIILKDADKMDKIHELEKYFQNPIATSIFVICYKKKTIDKRKKWVKLFQKAGFLFESKKIYDYQISKLIQIDLNDKNLKIEKSAEALLVSHLGINLSKISNAITKLARIVSDNVISVSDVQDHIGVHREYNNFELQNALGEKDTNKIISIMSYFSSNPNSFPLPPIIGALFSFFSKLLIIHSLNSVSDKAIAQKLNIHPYFLANYKKGCSNYSFDNCLRIVSVLKKYDLKFKGIQSNGSNDLLKGLIFDILFY